MYSTTTASDIRTAAAGVALTAAILAVGAVLPLVGWPIAVLVSRRQHPPANPAQSSHQRFDVGVAPAMRMRSPTQT
jgi:hypothetical protein